jgi:hypothetical protein
LAIFFFIISFRLKKVIVLLAAAVTKRKRKAKRGFTWHLLRGGATRTAPSRAEYDVVEAENVEAISSTVSYWVQ